MVVASEILMHMELLRYAPLLSAPAMHSETIAPWWRNWSEGIYNLVALFFSGLMFFIFWLMDRHNEQLGKLARHDALTGLLNRGTFMQELETACTRQHENVVACVMLCDIDHFHRINAQHGQPAGDRVLRRVAGFLKDMAASHGALAARYGGGAFALLLTGVDRATAQQLAERLGDYLASQSFESEGEPFAITMSTGIALDHKGDPSVLLKAADDELYSAKLSANNRAAVATAALMPRRA
jgi:diguanylate cyclase (GGDEF)-like protein